MKKRNEGFTLVELVIAIVILAIAVSPLLANFIQSSKLNLKSRKQLNALNLAQDIMEGMSQYTADDNATFLCNAAVSDNSILVAQRLLPVGTTVTSCSGQVASVSSPALANVTGAMPEDWNKCVYRINGIKTATGGYNNYDIKVTIDSTAISNNVDDGNYTDAVVAQTINGKDYAMISTVDQYFDVVYNIDADEEISAYGTLSGKSQKPEKGPADYKGNVAREIVIDIANTETDPTKDPAYSVKVKKIYTVATAAKIGLGFTGESADKNVLVEQSSDLSKATAKVMPRSVYLYFDGLSGTSDSNKEKITINNNTNNMIDVYLIRTVDGSTLTDTDVISYNNNYACDVYVNSVDSNAAVGASYVEKVNIISNLRYHLAYDNNERVYSEGTMVKLPGITDADVAATHYKRDRSLIFYNSATAIGNSPTQGNDFYEKYVSDGYKKTKKDVLYDVKIEIYENGKTNTIATYTGGLAN